ncbi:MAG: TlpA family protein disulfide reductase [Acidobacteriota bacterium]
MNADKKPEKFLLKLPLVLILAVSAATAGIVPDVRAAIARDDFARAEQEVAAYRKQNGVTSEMLEAMSWLARGALAQRRFDDARQYAAETRKLAAGVNGDRHLSLAIGAAIEVEAGALAGGGQRTEAVAFLKRELKTHWDTPLRTRIQKNLNLLTLEGKAAPALEVSHWLGPKPLSLAALRGKPVLLFFWAHWCGDCKAQLPALAEVERKFAPRGLVLLGPTQTYGYVARGEEAAPAQETPYIDKVRRELYRPLGAMPVPLSEENFKVYGASTVPTLVLIDRQGIVRLYHPDVMTYEELAAAIEKVLANG